MKQNNLKAVQHIKFFFFRIKLLLFFISALKLLKNMTACERKKRDDLLAFLREFKHQLERRRRKKINDGCDFVVVYQIISSNDFFNEKINRVICFFKLILYY